MGTSIPANSCNTNRCAAPAANPCLFKLPGLCVYYSGSNISGPDIYTGDNLNTIVTKIIDYIGDLPDGSVTSVGLELPDAFTVTGSPVTSSGTIQVTGAGTEDQYINGEGNLIDFPALPSADVQVYTDPVGTHNWTKLPNAKIVHVFMIAGGGGGARGGRNANNTNTQGGGGGQSGGVSFEIFPASMLPDTVVVTVGVGGTGAPGTNTNGSAASGTGGTSGGNSIFGDFVLAFGGQQSNGTAGGTGSGVGGFGTGTRASGQAGGTGSTGSSAPSVPTLSTNSLISTAGGGGAGISNLNAVNNGAASGAKSPYIPGTIASGAGGLSSGLVDGGNGSTNGLYATGGGGGASSITGNGGNGGNGALYGAGGGGGGASRNDVGTSGSGGNGAAGIVIVVTYF